MRQVPLLYRGAAGKDGKLTPDKTYKGLLPNPFAATERRCRQEGRQGQGGRRDRGLQVQERFPVPNQGAEGKTVAMPLPQMAWEKKDECLKAIGERKATLNEGKITEVKE